MARAAACPRAGTACPDPGLPPGSSEFICRDQGCGGRLGVAPASPQDCPGLSLQRALKSNS